MLTLQKHEGFYQNRVTGSLASILRPGNLATTVKWSIFVSGFVILICACVGFLMLWVVELIIIDVRGGGGGDSNSCVPTILSGRPPYSSSVSMHVAVF